jgi:hypothetical protein
VGQVGFAGVRSISLHVRAHFDSALQLPRVRARGNVAYFLFSVIFFTQLVTRPTAIIIGNGPRLFLRYPPLEAAEETNTWLRRSRQILDAE